MKKLYKLNVAFGGVLPPSTSGAPIQPFTLPITLLALCYAIIPSPLDPSVLPLVRSLHLDNQTYQTIRLLLPQLAALFVERMRSAADINRLLQASTSITSLSVHENNIRRLDDASKTVIKERIVEFRLIVVGYDFSSNSTLTTIIAGSKAMKKVILDGVDLSVADQVRPKILEMLKAVMAACKMKNIELWKENFEVGNGKVDLEK
jgi:hypothetical protein